MKEKKDQIGNVHTFEYDKLGRLSHDRVTGIPGGITGSILRISRTYEARGMLEKITSWDNATVGSGTLVITNGAIRSYPSK